MGPNYNAQSRNKEPLTIPNRYPNVHIALWGYFTVAEWGTIHMSTSPNGSAFCIYQSIPE